MVRTVGILIFDDVEVLDFAGPFEVFSVARLPGQDKDDERLFRVLTIAEHSGLVTCRGGLFVQPHTTMDGNPPLDILVIPGGQGTRRERHNSRVLDWISRQNEETELTMSVCTGALLLAERGLLNGRQATTHWGALDLLRQDYPAVTVVAGQRWVDEGHILTSAGISAGIDLSLHVVARLHGIEAAVWTARRMEYEWAGDTNSPG